MAKCALSPSVVEVLLWGCRVGALIPCACYPGYFDFEYDEEFAHSGIELSPLWMPAMSGRTYRFQTLQQQTFHGLPGLIADALPDKFGTALINESLRRQGYRTQEITSLERLMLIGRHAMGALECKSPAEASQHDYSPVPLEMPTLVEDAGRVLRGEFSQVSSQLLEVGSSAAGAKAKAVIGWNPETDEIVSGQHEVPEGFEHWMLKVDVDPQGVPSCTTGFGRMEYANSLMAQEAGVEMSECRLMEEGGRAHFMTKRFDREGNRKIHVHSLCGIAHLDFNQLRVHSYEQYLRTIQALNLGKKAIDQAFVRCAFNVVAANCDDHTKNLAFMLEEGGEWRLAPAYDMGFAYTPTSGRPCEHLMQVNGKTRDIGQDDLLDIARRFGVTRARERLDRVIEAVRRWPELADKAEVPIEVNG